MCLRYRAPHGKRLGATAGRNAQGGLLAIEKGKGEWELHWTRLSLYNLLAATRAPYWKRLGATAGSKALDGPLAIEDNEAEEVDRCTP